MPAFKLISADSHVNEPPAAWERVQKEYGERAPKVVKDPPGVPEGIWLLDRRPASGRFVALLEGARSSTRTKASRKSSRKNTSRRFGSTKTFATKITPAGGDRRRVCKDQDTDGIEAEVLFSSAVRQLYSIVDRSFCSAPFFAPTTPGSSTSSAADNPKVLHRPGNVYPDPGYRAHGRGHPALRPARFSRRAVSTWIRDSEDYEAQYEPMWAALEDNGMVVNVHTSATQASPAPIMKGRARLSRKKSLGFAGNKYLRSISQHDFVRRFRPLSKFKVVCAEFDVGWVAIWSSRSTTGSAETAPSTPRKYQ